MKILWTRKCEDCGALFSYTNIRGKAAPYNCEKCRTAKVEVQLSATPPVTLREMYNVGQNPNYLFRNRQVFTVVDEYRRTIRRNLNRWGKR
jgi:hypothetical protein